MLSDIVKIVRPDTHVGCLDIKKNMVTMRMSNFKYDIPKAKLYIAEWINEISIAGETYSEVVSQQFNLYSISSFPLFRDYMETSGSDDIE